jgi:hypothetical protein
MSLFTAIKSNFEPINLPTSNSLGWKDTISAIFGEGSVDRLPVLVSGDGMDKLLGVPKVSSGTGENEATAVNKLVAEWQLIEKVQAMCFDTTSVNTGRHSRRYHWSWGDISPTFA